METEVLPVDPLPQDAAQQLLDFELAVLRALPNVNSVADFPPGGISAFKANDPNSNGVRLRLNGRMIKQTFNKDISDKVQAARVLKERMKGDDCVGKAAVLLAEEQVRLGLQAAPQPSAPRAELTEAKLEWLSNWYDAQPEPHQVALEMADAALAQRRQGDGQRVRAQHCDHLSRPRHQADGRHAQGPRLRLG